MRELVEWTRTQLKSDEHHPILVIALFILEFLAIHPFHDGNGRLSRVLTNLLLAQSGYGYMPYASLEKIIEDHKAEYYLALRHGQKDLKSPSADASRWLHFFVDCMLRQIEVLKGFLAGAATREELLSENQLQTLKLLDKYDEITTRLVAEKLKISPVTAKQVLGRLLELKIIQRQGAGRSVRYRRIGAKPRW
jgi:Fic family protein